MNRRLPRRPAVEFELDEEPERDRRDVLRSFAPGLQVLRRYRRRWWRADVFAGVAVAAYLVPQVMAYAAIVDTPPVAGLWTALAACLVYAVLGGSRVLSVGPESTVALLAGATVAPFARGDPAAGGRPHCGAVCDRRAVVPDRPAGPARRGRRPALPAPAGRLSRRRRGADGGRPARPGNRHRGGRRDDCRPDALLPGRGRLDPPADPGRGRRHPGTAAGRRADPSHVAWALDRRGRRHDHRRRVGPAQPWRRGDRRGAVGSARAAHPDGPSGRT